MYPSATYTQLLNPCRALSSWARAGQPLPQRNFPQYPDASEEAMHTHGCTRDLGACPKGMWSTNSREMCSLTAAPPSTPHWGETGGCCKISNKYSQIFIKKKKFKILVWIMAWCCHHAEVPFRLSSTQIPNQSLPLLLFPSSPWHLSPPAPS